MAYVLLGEGIPTVYQGDEAGFTGGGPPGTTDRREPLWWGGYRTDSPRYAVIWKVSGAGSGVGGGAARNDAADCVEAGVAPDALFHLSKPP